MPKVYAIGEGAGQEAHEDLVRAIVEEETPPGALEVAYVCWGAAPEVPYSGRQPEAYLGAGTGRAEAIDYCVAQGALGIVASYGGMFGFREAWERARAAGVWCWHAHHGNDDEASATPPRLYYPVCVGADDPEAPGGETTYGPGLEVDTQDERAESGAGDEGQSTAVPTLAAVMLRAYLAGVSENYWDLRALVRQSADAYAAGRTDAVGYGFVHRLTDLADALPVEPQPPVDLRAEYGDGTLTLRWVPFATTGFSRTVIVTPDGIEHDAGEDESLTLPGVYGPAGAFTFYSEVAGGARSRDDGTNILNLTGLPEAAPTVTATRTPAGVVLAVTGEEMEVEVERAPGAVAVQVGVDASAAPWRAYAYRARYVLYDDSAGPWGAWAYVEASPAYGASVPAALAAAGVPVVSR